MMIAKNCLVFPFVSILLGFAMAATWVVPVFADGEQPPVAPEVVIAPDDSGDPGVPEESAVPAAVEETQPAVAGDPLWCPAGVAPKANTGGCSPTFNRFGSSSDSGSLIDWLEANQPNKAGTIWVEHDYDNSAVETLDIVLSGADYATLDNYALTIQGGWNGIAASKLLNATDPYSHFNKSLSVIGWSGAVTINNVIIGNALTNVASTTFGLNVATKGNILLNNVFIQGGQNTDGSHVMNGAVLDNTSGAGTITVNNSDFSGNEGFGLSALSKNAITLNGISANLNGGDGVALTNNSVQGKAVTLKGLKEFNHNAGDGLKITSAGLITLSNLVAHTNGGAGVFLDNTSSVSNLGVTVGGVNSLLSNGGVGIEIYSHGVITASNLNASYNSETGAILDNCDDEGLGCTAIVAKFIKLTGSNIFNGNGATNENGLEILSFGAISVNALNASGNVGSGAYIDNARDNVNGLASTGTWTLTGYGSFNDNGGNGLEAHTNGNMVLLNLNASNNGGDGANLVTDKAAGGSNFTLGGFNVLSDNGGCGLCVVAAGAITASNITANGNGGVGASLDNLYDAAKPFNTAIKGTNLFNHNGGEGLSVHSFGTILANNLTANSNGVSSEVGVILDNCNQVVLCGTTIAKTITVTGYLNASRNAGNGVGIDSLGAVTITNLLTELNNGAGAILNNNYDPTKAQAVTLKGSNFFNYNGDTGLTIATFGAITANNLTALGNDASGAILDNIGGVTPKSITLTGANIFVGNYADGLNFNASGSAILNRINADGNGWSVAGNGLTGTAGTSITLACAHLTNQTNGAGYDLSAAVSITLSGIYLYNNNLINTTHTTPTVTTIFKPCVLP
ncbi:MAG: right-handed parallel beta-helix repeat-containing protein [Anaerolineales bacterium]|nr:right-handed parallel beta-helix repeat-containing protein [Anaerolineales bacterium]